MAAPINLRRWRKSRARDEKRARGDANAALHGRNKGQKLADSLDRARAARHLDAHRLGEGYDTKAPTGD